MLIKNKNGLLENMYLLPQYEVESPYSFIEAFKEDYDIELEVLSHLKDFKHVFTHRTWYMHVYIFRANKHSINFYTNKEQEEITSVLFVHIVFFNNSSNNWMTNNIERC